MIIWEAVAGCVLGVLLLVSASMAIIGLLGATGLRLSRCRLCGHLVADPGPAMACPHCEHPWLVQHLMPVRLHHLLPGEFGPITRGSTLPGRTGPRFEPAEAPLPARHV